MDPQRQFSSKADLGSFAMLSGADAVYRGYYDGSPWLTLIRYCRGPQTEQATLKYATEAK